MTTHINAGKAGVVVGTIMGLWHLSWSTLVALGWAQPVIDFIFWIHFLKPVYAVEPFDIARAVGLVAVTLILGFFIGLIAGLIWNALHRTANA